VLSIVFVVGALAVILVVGAYLWWKTRAVREQMRTPRASGEIIEGVVVREVVTDNRPEHRK
jgi:Flp pilus assembly protein TadB